MDAKEQADGERRVRARLIDPLERLGLAKPSTLTRAQFAAMCDELCQRLAYLDDTDLDALAEAVAAHPGGKDRDRFPIGVRILAMAAEIRRPQSDGSPLMRKVFASPLGAEALAGGFAPELLEHLRRFREWPKGAWTMARIREAADDPRRMLEDIELRMARGEVPTPAEAAFRDKRLAAIRRCEEIRALGQNGGSE